MGRKHGNWKIVCFPNLHAFVHNNQLNKEQVFYFFQLYSRGYYKLVILSLPITNFQKHLKIGKNGSFFGIVVLNSIVSCFFDRVLSSALCNKFTFAEKSVSFFLAWLKLEWSAFFSMKKSCLFEPFRWNIFLQNSFLMFFQSLILLFRGFWVWFLLLVQISFHVFLFFLVIFYNKN